EKLKLRAMGSGGVDDAADNYVFESSDDDYDVIGLFSVTASRLCRERRLHRTQKDRTQNKVVGDPGDARAEERQGGEQDKAACCFDVNSCSPIRKGQRPGLPL